MAELAAIVEGWTGEIGPFTLLADDVAFDLTGLQVDLILKDARGDAVTTTGNTRIDASPATGQVYYKPDAGDFSTARQPYSVRWKVTGSDGVVFFPSDDPDTIVVRRP